MGWGYIRVLPNRKEEERRFTGCENESESWRRWRRMAERVKRRYGAGEAKRVRGRKREEGARWRRSLKAAKLDGVVNDKERVRVTAKF